jgi:hypothetical protein
MALEFYIAGNAKHHMGHTPRIALATTGIPLVIPKSLHYLIINGDKGCIRVCLGMLSVFRILPLQGKDKLSTITGEFLGLSKTLKPSRIEEV